jgi:hypothetical protein
MYPKTFTHGVAYSQPGSGNEARSRTWWAVSAKQGQAASMEKLPLPMLGFDLHAVISLAIT